MWSLRKNYKYANTYIILCSMWMYMVVNHTRNNLFHLLCTLMSRVCIHIVHHVLGKAIAILPSIPSQPHPPVSPLFLSLTAATRRSTRIHKAELLGFWQSGLEFTSNCLNTSVFATYWSIHVFFWSEIGWIDIENGWRNGICWWFGPQNMIVMCFKTAAYV